MEKISAIVLTKDSEATLENTLISLKDFAEVVILDSGSSDQTLLIANRFNNTKVYKEKEFKGFGKMRQLATSKATHDWILSIDSDESLSDELLKELKSTHLDINTLYAFPFKNFFQGKWIKGCGWYPDKHVRLFHRSNARYSDDEVHEKLIATSTRTRTMNSPFHHISYRTLSDFIKKMQLYSDLYAEQYHNKKHPSFLRALLSSFYTFIKCYILQRGILDGKEGLIISLYNSQTCYYKYLKLREKNRGSS